MTSRATSTKTASAARKKKANRTDPLPTEVTFESQTQGETTAQMESTLIGLATLIKQRGLRASKLRRSNVTYSDKEIVTRIEISLDIPVKPG